MSWEPVQPRRDRCENCHFFEMVGYGGYHAGNCLRHAPSARQRPAHDGVTAPDAVMALWPVVSKGWWCGDYARVVDPGSEQA